MPAVVRAPHATAVILVVAGGDGQSGHQRVDDEVSETSTRCSGNVVMPVVTKERKGKDAGTSCCFHYQSPMSLSLSLHWPIGWGLWLESMVGVYRLGIWFESSSCVVARSVKLVMLVMLVSMLGFCHVLYSLPSSLSPLA